MLEFHDLANIFPMMSASEFDALKADMLEHGYRKDSPIVLFEGKILDGRNRYNAAQELGVKAEYIKFNGGGDPIDFVISSNLHRRHLSESQQAACAAEASNIKRGGIRLGQNTIASQTANLQFEGKMTQLQAAAKFGVSPRMVAAAKKVRRKSRKLFEQVKTGKITVNKAVRQIDKAERIDQLKKAVKEVKQSEQPFKLICSNISDLGLDEGSIDVIITDPPYPKEYLNLYSILAEQAAKWLKPGGSLIVMAGQSYLPEIIKMLCAHLNYQWIVSYQTPGGQSPQIWDRKVNTFWKPVLWYIKGKYDGDWIGDVCKSDNNDKRFDEWGQSESGFMHLIEKFSKPGQTVLDPFCGGGTTGVAALSLGRYFIGSDSNMADIKICKARLTSLR